MSSVYDQVADDLSRGMRTDLIVEDLVDQGYDYDQAEQIVADVQHQLDREQDWDDTVARAEKRPKPSFHGYTVDMSWLFNVEEDLLRDELRVAVIGLSIFTIFQPILTGALTFIGFAQLTVGVIALYSALRYRFSVVINTVIVFYLLLQIFLAGVLPYL